MVRANGSTTSTKKQSEKNKVLFEAEPLSFEDVYGATVSIPSGKVADYAAMRAEQLNDLTRILAASKHIGLPASSVEALTAMANELANSVSCLVELVIADVRNITEGGAK